MFKNIFFLIGVLSTFTYLNAQQPYEFIEVIDIDATPVISQGKTNTCWSFSGTSFLESEIIRMTGKQIDLSEIFTVKNTYLKKAENYVMRQGKAQFSEGGLAHDVLNTVAEFGLVPNTVFSGLLNHETNHNHYELYDVLKSMVKTYAEHTSRKLDTKWIDAIDAVLTVYLGSNPKIFAFEGKSYTPESFLAMTKIKPSDYVSITSFTHQPFYTKFILNIPDNWSNGSYYNVPLDDMIKSIKNALKNGYTVALDCDVSEPTFSSKAGVAIIPINSENNLKALKAIYPEKVISQKYRQDEFENFTTTDDHLMHITGLFKDQEGTTYYKVKNSWGTNPYRNANGGFVYFSESYMRLKSISVTFHKDAMLKVVANKLGVISK